MPSCPPCGPPGPSQTPRVYGSIKGNKLLLQGHPNADIVMEVENDEWTLKHGNCVMLKVAADGDEVLCDSYMGSVLEIVKRSVFHSCARFQSEVVITGRLTVDGPIVAFTNLPVVTDTTGLLRLYIDPVTGEIVASPA